MASSVRLTTPAKSCAAGLARRRIRADDGEYWVHFLNAPSSSRAWGGVTVLMLMAMGLLLIGSVCFLVYLLVRSQRLSKPLTLVETLKAAPPFNSNVSRQP